MEGSEGASVTSPIVGTASLSNSGSQVVPALVVFQTPPEAAPTYTMLGFDSTTAKSSMRPPMIAGPSSRHCRFFSAPAGVSVAGQSSPFACAARGARAGCSFAALPLRADFSWAQAAGDAEKMAVKLKPRTSAKLARRTRIHETLIVFPRSDLKMAGIARRRGADAISRERKMQLPCLGIG